MSTTMMVTVHNLQMVFMINMIMIRGFLDTETTKPDVCSSNFTFKIGFNRILGRNNVLLMYAVELVA